jgi:hypothetical protein
VPVVSISFASGGHPNRDVVMYPNPDVVAKAAVTSDSTVGADFAHTLATDPKVQQLANERAPKTPVNALPLPAAFTQITQLLDTAIHI